ncbi:MAG: c-type cytochrome, partial [Candidatus Porifericomitaceae bacterium WSBS_2022_MAG_OTU9]
DGNSNNPDWPSLAGQHRQYTVRQLQHFRDGRRVNEQMSAMATNLSDADIADIATWYSSQTGKWASPNSVKAAQLGERIYRVGNETSGVPACIGCHGANGQGNPLAKYPVLAGQHAKYTENQLRQFHEGHRDNDDNAVMRSIAGKMTNFEIRAVSEYISGLH